MQVDYYWLKRILIKTANKILKAGSRGVVQEGPAACVSSARSNVDALHKDEICACAAQR